MCLLMEFPLSTSNVSRAFFFNWSRGKFRTFSFHEKYGAKYKNIYLRTNIGIIDIT